MVPQVPASNIQSFPDTRQLLTERSPAAVSFRLAVCAQGMSPDPDHVAFREPMTRQPLYRVRFAQSDVWPEYASGSKDTLDIEIHQHWLEPASIEDLKKQEV